MQFSFLGNVGEAENSLGKIQDIRRFSGINIQDVLERFLEYFRDFESKPAFVSVVLYFLLQFRTFRSFGKI